MIISFCKESFILIPILESERKLAEISNVLMSMDLFILNVHKHGNWEETVGTPV